MLSGFNIDEMSSSQLKQTGLINTIKSKLLARKDRETKERERCDLHNLLSSFKRQLHRMKQEFEAKKISVQG